MFVRTWIFRILVVAAAAIFAVAWFLPWWGILIHELGNFDAVSIRPYGMTMQLGDYGAYLKSTEMPVWFTPFMWAYFGLSTVGMLFGAAISNKNKQIKLGKFKMNASRFLIGGIGITYVIVVVAAVAVISIRAGSNFNTPLQGYMFIDMGAPYQSGANTSLRLGFWLACVAGPLAIILSVFKNKITGKIKVT